MRPKAIVAAAVAVDEASSTLWIHSLYISTPDEVRADVRAMQQRLEKQGLDAGGTDGLVGFRTRVAIGIWQNRNGRPETCFPDAALVREAGR